MFLRETGGFRIQNSLEMMNQNYFDKQGVKMKELKMKELFELLEKLLGIVPRKQKVHLFRRSYRPKRYRYKNFVQNERIT